MASALDTHAGQLHGPPEEVAAVVDADELEVARHDPRVKAFLADADAYLAEVERQGRNR
jgi:hypothetical protein